MSILIMIPLTFVVFGCTLAAVSATIWAGERLLCAAEAANIEVRS